MKALSLTKGNSGITEHISGNGTILLLLQLKLEGRCAFAILWHME